MAPPPSAPSAYEHGGPPAPAVQQRGPLADVFTRCATYLFAQAKSAAPNLVAMNVIAEAPIPTMAKAPIPRCRHISTSSITGFILGNAAAGAACGAHGCVRVRWRT